MSRIPVIRFDVATNDSTSFVRSVCEHVWFHKETKTTINNRGDIGFFRLSVRYRFWPVLSFKIFLNLTVNYFIGSFIGRKQNRKDKIYLRKYEPFPMVISCTFYEKSWNDDGQSCSIISVDHANRLPSKRHCNVRLWVTKIRKRQSKSW